MIYRIYLGDWPRYQKIVGIRGNLKKYCVTLCKSIISKVTLIPCLITDRM